VKTARGYREIRRACPARACPARERKRKEARRDTGAKLGFEPQLWAAGNALRGSMDAAEYRHVALGLVFLRSIADASSLTTKNRKGFIGLGLRLKEFERKMPQIGDNIDFKLADGLRNVLPGAASCSFCVGYCNLRGWGQFADLVDEPRGKDERSVKS